ncbi:MAG: GGDEF domain-containing protein [Patescibacteria group bacterium]|jgi:diguanylate cyclase (GGDEF)-like protein
MIGQRSEPATLPDDPEELKKLLLAERASHDASKQEISRMTAEYWEHAMNGMVAKGLKAATFLAHPHGKILRCSDAAELCGSEEEMGGSVYSVIFDRLRDPRDFYASSSEDTGVHRVPRLFSEELRNELGKALKTEPPARGRSRRRTIQTLFSRTEVAVLDSPSKGPIDVMVSIAYGLDHNEHEWLHVSLIDVDAVSCDPLTGLRYVKTLMRSVSRDIAECERAQHGGTPCVPVSVILFDGDGLKKVNDTYGHYAGNQVIQAMSRRASRFFSRPSDLLTRQGGDEFAAKLIAGAEAALAHGEKIRKAVGGAPIPVRLSPDDDERIMLDMTISVGVATYEAGLTAEALVARADQALYHAKRSGRNRTSDKISALVKP